jgi:transcriptional regulator with XRE-family HTH domain
MINMPMINMQKTGANIKMLMKLNNIKVIQIQDILGFNTPQAIYKWLRGETMPTIDNMVILATLLNTTIDNIIITEMI